MERIVTPTAAIRYSSDYGFGHLYIDINTYETDADREDMSFFTNYDPLNNLRITNQYNLDEPGKPSYGWDFITGDEGPLNLMAMEDKIKILRKVNRALENYRKKNGTIATYKEYVAVILKALKIKKVRYSEGNLKPVIDSMSSGTVWHEVDVAEGLSLINRVDTLVIKGK